MRRPVPVDIRALVALKRSSLALDLYSWLTYRMSYMRKRTRVPWSVLQHQFGLGYPLTARGLGNFRRNTLIALRKVEAIYPAIANRVVDTGGTLELLPSATHVPKKLWKTL